jgi:hypothetical protein
MTTNLNYPKPVKPDDGCNWLPVILWRMNAARARSRSVFVAAPRRNLYPASPRKNRLNVKLSPLRFPAAGVKPISAP